MILILTKMYVLLHYLCNVLFFGFCCWTAKTVHNIPFGCGK